MRRKSGAITIKERKFVKKLIETGNQTKAFELVYNTHSKRRESIRTMAKDVMKRPIVKEYLNEQLNRAGLSLENLNDKLYNAINHNLDNGKPSQAVGGDLLKFSYKLHDAIPSNKTLSAKLSIKAEGAQVTDLNALQQQLQDLAKSNEAILNELKK